MVETIVNEITTFLQDKVPEERADQGLESHTQGLEQTCGDESPRDEYDEETGDPESVCHVGPEDGGGFGVRENGDDELRTEEHDDQHHDHDRGDGEYGEPVADLDVVELTKSVCGSTYWHYG